MNFVVKKRNKTKVASFTAVLFISIGCLFYIVYAYRTSVPDWVVGSAKFSWTQEVEEMAAERTKGPLIPTGLGLSGTYWNHSATGGEHPYTLVTYMDVLEAGDSIPEDFKAFKERGIFCSASHTMGADLGLGTQFFYENDWDENKIPDWVVGNDEDKKFNFLMIVCAIEIAEQLTSRNGGRTASGDYIGAAEFLSAFPIMDQCTEEQPGFDMNSMDNSLAMYRNNDLRRRALSDTAIHNPTVYAQLNNPMIGSPFTNIPDGNYMDGFFCTVWTSAKMAMDFHTLSPTHNFIPIEEGGRFVVNIDASYQNLAEPILLEFDTVGDWVSEGYTIDTAAKTVTYRLVSDTGIVADDGVIATGKKSADNYVELAVLGTNSKLATFKCYSRAFEQNKDTGEWIYDDTLRKGSFDGTQTFFSVYGDDQFVIRAASATDTEITVERFKHEEEWQTDYNVDLAKFDSETGKPLEGSIFDILEKDTLDEQLPGTNLDDEGPAGSLDGTGTFVVTEWEEDDPHDTLDENYQGFDDLALVKSQVNLYNWGNDNGTQFSRWSDPHDDACLKDINITGADGHIYYGDNFGKNSGDRAHKDIYKYTYQKGYCTGHPTPQPEYIPVPEPEYDEDGECVNQDAIDAAIEENKRIHTEAWNAWYNEVKICETLASEGGFFHCIIPGDTAKDALQSDRDQFFVDYISLTYDYSAIETTAREGYIRHGVHMDDIPIEWRVVTSIQFKDYQMNGIIYQDSGGSSGEDEDLRFSDANQIHEGGSNNPADVITPSRSESFTRISAATSANAEAVEDAEGYVGDGDIYPDKPDHTATSANAGAAGDHNGKRLDLSGAASARIATGLFSGMQNSIGQFLSPVTATGANSSPDKNSSFYSDGDGDEDDDDSGGSTGGLRSTILLKPSTVIKIKQGEKNICDWTFIIYDHRTEGELHINKQDLNLFKQNDEYDSYAATNGDGIVEGALYGLFARNDIAHPDGKSGIIYKKDNLMSVAAIDRDGNASFLVLTEAPGKFYDYNIGSIVNTEDGWYLDAPGNLYISEDASAQKESDMEQFIGHNPDGSPITAGNGNDLTDTSAGNGSFTDDSFDKHSSNQGYDDTYCEDTTIGYYPIGNNQDNNGNCWIGRPLFVNGETAAANYYIRELSRSEGYELSVTGKDNSITNGALTGEELNTNVSAAAEGNVKVGDKLAMNVTNMENTFSIISNGTVNGYDITLYGIPEQAKFVTYTRTVEWSDEGTHMETEYVTVPMTGSGGTPVIIDGGLVYGSVGDIITLPNGETATIQQVSQSQDRTKVVTPKNTVRMTIPAFTGSTSTTEEDFILDADWLIGLSRGKAPANAPWIAIELTGTTADEWAAALYSGMTDHGLEVFNRITIEGPVELSGKTYAVVRYAYQTGTQVIDSVYDEAQDILYVKQEVTFVDGDGNTNGFVYVPYQSDEFISSTTASGFVTSAVVPRKELEPAIFTYPQDIQYLTQTEQSKTYWVYDGSEQLRGNDGSLQFKTVAVQVEKPGHYETVYTETELTQVEYVDGVYKIHVDEESGEHRFKITYDTDLSTAIINIELAKKNGVISVSPTVTESESYLEFVNLPYINDSRISQDAGTIAIPIGVLERPIRQKIKVTKDIQVLQQEKVVWYCLNCGHENAEGTAVCGHCETKRTTEATRTISYIGDTYSAVHADNREANGSGNTGKDWLTSLLNGNKTDASATHLPNFRFKAYLKSNLERLYRDQDGKVVWMDRNGNVMVPQYQDTNGDGNYDTFTWQYAEAFEGKVVDFPEQDVLSVSGALESANVQKIYTRADHNKDSMTTSGQANNVWDDYETPQTGNTHNVGEKEEFSTSLRIKPDGSAGDLSGKAVDTNAALYSYDGKNTDVAKSDRINNTQNTGFTRILETRLSIIEDGAQTRAEQQYNYEKFFDAVAAANTDIWDDDMHSTYTGSSMNNYPGQHWFETFYEQYQMDDADPDHTLENTDGVDPDGTAGGDRDTSFKPIRWIRENIFGNRTDYETYPARQNGANTEVNSSTSAFAKANAEASDAVRQFAAKWYLKDEAAKLMTDNGVAEDIAKPDGAIDYDEAIYDEALFHAIAKSYNYLRPFYENDLDTIYSVEWDSEERGGADSDYTTLSIDLAGDRSYYNISAYLPYGTYVIVEQQPQRIDGVINDVENRSYAIEKPKEVMLPSLYDGPQANETTDNYHPHYLYDVTMKTTEQAKAANYLIRFGDEWTDHNEQDQREFVIRAHNHHGDFEVYKYGLDIDKLTGSIIYPGGTYTYAGYRISQDGFDPLKDYYDTKHWGAAGTQAIGTELGGHDDSDYLAIYQTNGKDTPNGSTYDGIALKNRFFYASISEDRGITKDLVPSMTGELTAYQNQYASMLVPWTVTAPADLGAYSAANFSGYADVNERDVFYTAMLRINKVDSETGEYILHDNAIFALYAGSRYNTFEEITKDANLIDDAAERAVFLAQFKPGDAKFYLKDTTIQGTREFLMAIGAAGITPVAKGNSAVDLMAGYDELCSGLVKKGTPICVESERIMLMDELGARTGQMTVYTTLNDVLVAGEEDPADKVYANQNTGYFTTPQPIGAGVYVLAEIKAPDGYARSKPVPFEVYSDQTQYYVDGDMYSKVQAVRYEGGQPENNR